VRLLFLAYELDQDSTVVGWQAKVALRLADRTDLVIARADRVGRIDQHPRLQAAPIPARPAHIPRSVGGGHAYAVSLAALAKRERVDACIVHMAHHWAARLGPMLRLLRVPTILWYAHGSVSRSLRRAHRGASAIVTSSSEGFRLPSTKVTVIGQGIDTDLFRPLHEHARNVVLSVGRISARKRIDRIVDVAAALESMKAPTPIRIRIVGPTATREDVSYRSEMVGSIARRGLASRVALEPALLPAALAAAHGEAFAHLNLSETGSMDKTVLEALACGVPAVTSNVAFVQMLRELHGDLLVEPTASPPEIAERLCARFEARGQLPSTTFRDLIVGHHDLDSYTDRLLTVVRTVTAR
jgi:glycosyltransferase involved in cell wall biosynthesis